TRGPRGLLMEPRRMGVVKERHHGLQSDSAQIIDELPVALQRLVIELTALRLDTTPGDRETESVRAGGSGEIGVLFIAPPRVDGASARFPARPSLVLPLRPV